MLKFTPIGEVRSKFNEPVGPDEMKEHESTIIIKPEYEDGLYKIEENDYIQVLFYLDLAKGYDLKSERHHGDVKGLFASRSPRRPNPIGLTTVELLERNRRELKVWGLDAVDGTPILDLKPYAPTMDEPGNINEEDLQENPRTEINQLIKTKNHEKLLLKAGELHGHFCPYLSLGVKAGSFALKKLGISSTGMEDVMAIVETNSCFSDGIQYSTGCTFGNNGLIYRDYGKTAVTISKRGDKGIRMKVKDENDLISEKDPEAKELFEKVVKNREGTEKDRKALNKKWNKLAFQLIKTPINELFEIKEVKPDLPEHAPIFEDNICDKCGEKIMAPKSVKRNEKTYCIPCSNSNYLQLDGRGLNHIKKK